jgi:hypothetical protein
MALLETFLNTVQLMVTQVWPGTLIYKSFQALRLWAEVDTFTANNKVVPAGKPVSHVSPLQWDLDASAKNHLQTSTSNVHKFIDSLQTSVLNFTKFGKNGITANKVSPDAFVQVDVSKLGFEFCRWHSN